MKKLQILILLCFAFTMFTACGSDLDCTDAAGLESMIQPELEAANAAVIAYNADISMDNCNDLVDALENYRDALNDIEECISDEERADYEQVLSTIDEDLDALNC